MNSSLFFEIFFIIATTVGAFFFARTHLQTPTRTLSIITIIVGIALFGVDRLIWANTNKGIFDHLTCIALPDSMACTKDKSSDQTTAKPAAIVPATTQFSSSKDFFDQGFAAYNTKNYGTARQFFKQACDRGGADGCYNLGFMWYQGEGGDIDQTFARQFFKQACDRGGADGCYSLALLWQKGEGGDIDQALARQLYKQACDGGEAKGCFNLGAMLREGEGGDIDPALARQLDKLACDRGDAKGCNNLGAAWEYSAGGGTDKTLARQLYKQACDGGVAKGCENLRRLTTAL